MLGAIPTKDLKHNEPSPQEFSQAVARVLSTQNNARSNMPLREFDFVIQLVQEMKRMAGTSCHHDVAAQALLQELDSLLVRHSERSGLVTAVDDLRLQVTFFHDAATNIKLAIKETLEVDGLRCSQDRRALYYDFIPSKLVQPLKGDASWVHPVLTSAATSSWVNKRSTTREDISKMEELLVDNVMLDVNAGQSKAFAAHLTAVLPAVFSDGSTSELIDAIMLRAIFEVRHQVGHTAIKAYGAPTHMVGRLLSKCKNAAKSTLILKYYGNEFDVAMMLGAVPTKGLAENKPTAQVLARVVSAQLRKSTSLKQVRRLFPPFFRRLNSMFLFYGVLSIPRCVLSKKQKN